MTAVRVIWEEREHVLGLLSDCYHQQQQKRSNGTMNAPIQVGSTCVVQGLIAQPAFNGHTVRVVQYDQVNGRFTVSPVATPSPLPSSLAVRPQNLVPTAPPITNLLEPGTPCILQGLETAAFNGHRVVVIQFLPHEQRYQVRPEGPGTPLPPILHIKPENLRDDKPPPPPPVAPPTPIAGPIENFPSRRDLMEGYRSQLSQSSLSQAPHIQMMRRPSNASISGGSVHRVPSFRDVRSIHNLRQGMTRSGSSASLDPSVVSYHSRPMERVSSMASIASRAPVAQIPEGSKALLQGLQFQPSLNGTVVKVIEYVSSMRRYRVVAAPTDETPERFMVVQPHNLLPVLEMVDSRSVVQEKAGSSLFRQGDKVVLKNLCAQPHLNDSVATVKAYIRETDRYLIQVDDNPLEVMMLKARNLEGLDDDEYRTVKEDRRPALRRTPSSGTIVSRMSTTSQSTRRWDVTSQNGSERPATQPQIHLEHGTRVVILSVEGKVDLSGELAVIHFYVPTSKSYRVRLLGAKAIEANDYMDETLVERDSLRVVSEACFWALMKQKGKAVRVPATCEFMTGTKQLRLRIDAFAGVDRAIPAARMLLGEILCDWSSQREIIASLYENPTPPLKYVKIPTDHEPDLLQEEEILVDVALAAKNAFFKALIEYQLIRPTGSSAGEYQVFKVCFPFPRAGDDENPFSGGSGDFGAEPRRPTDVVSWTGGDCLSVVSSVNSSTYASERRQEAHQQRSSRPRTRAMARERANKQRADDPELELYEKYDPAPPADISPFGKKDPDPVKLRMNDHLNSTVEGFGLSMSSLSSFGTSETSGETVEESTLPPPAQAPEKKEPHGQSGTAALDRSNDPPAAPRGEGPPAAVRPQESPPSRNRDRAPRSVTEHESETDETDSREARRERRRKEKKARKKEEKREREERKALKKSLKRMMQQEQQQQQKQQGSQTPDSSSRVAQRSARDDIDEVNMKSIACFSSSWNWTDKTIDGEGIIH